MARDAPIRARAGDGSPEAEAAFAAVVEEYRPALRRIARVYGAPGGDQEDLYQEILLQVWRSLPSFRGDSALGTWVYRVALNTGLNHRRQSLRRPLLVPAPEAKASPSASDAYREERILRQFLDGLGPIDRAVLLLYMEGLPQSQISEVTGLGASAVAVRIHRMKQSFKKQFME